MTAQPNYCRPDPAPRAFGIHDAGWRELDDGAHLSLTTREQIDYWTRLFGVTERGLRFAVERVGTDIDAVRRELGGR